MAAQDSLENPSPEDFAEREDSRAKARRVRSSMDYRFKAIEPYIRGKDVLDVGAGSGYWRADWAHGRIMGAACRTVGVDHIPEYVEEARARGAEMVLGDVETLDLGDNFDVVVAGEIIEHVSNAGQFIATCAAHLRPGGKLILTTPNAFSLSNLLRRGVLRQPPNSDHTVWYCERTLAQSVERYDFSVDSVSFLRHEIPGKLRRAFLRPVNAIVGEKLASSTLMVVATYR